MARMVFGNFRTIAHGVYGGGADAEFSERQDLILHEGDERGNHNAYASAAERAGSGNRVIFLRLWA